MNFDTDIRSFVTVPDHLPEQATPFQGFAPSLCMNDFMLPMIRQIPNSIYDFTPDGHKARLPMRMSGKNSTKWFGQSPRAARAYPVPIILPFTLYFLGPDEAYSDYAEWAAKAPWATLIGPKGAHFDYEELGFDTLQARFLSICDMLDGSFPAEQVAEARDAIGSWERPTVEDLGYGLKHHGNIGPNIAALEACGFAGFVKEPFRDFTSGEGPHIEQIVRSTNSIFEFRGSIPEVAGHEVYPPQPDLNIYLPATYELNRWDLDKMPHEKRKAFRTAIQLLERQKGYSFDLTTDAQMRAMVGASTDELEAGAEPRSNPVMHARQIETWFGTEVVSTLAASEISAVVRPPNRLNRTRGMVRQFAQQYRSDRPKKSKRADKFRAVQKAIGEAFPQELQDLIPKSQTGIRIIADAHIEWLDTDGIPLGIRYDVSRIPVTPGNLFTTTMSALPQIELTTDAFNEVLVLSALEDTDPIAKMFDVAFGTFSKLWRDKMDVRVVRVRSEEELVDALNSFKGALAIFDGHGSHKAEEAGRLWLGNTAVNVWDIDGKVHHPPPIMVLSACDTHAADRNHATVANGFLAAGCRTVLGSVFPIDARDAAMFSARLLYRVAEFLPAAVKGFGRSFTWMEIVSGMLRMQMATDILHHLVGTGDIPRDQYQEVSLRFSKASNSGHPDPFAYWIDTLIADGIDETRLRRQIRIAIAGSSTISYLQLGRPETILIR